MKRHYSPDQDNLFIIDAIESLEGFEVAIGGAPATGRLPARIIRKEEITIGVLGGANAARGVSALLDSDELTERLTVYEIHTPSGNWSSSFPPHRHDTRDNSSYHEETSIATANGRSRRNGCRHDSDRSVTQRALDHERRPYYQQVIIGLIIVLAVGFDYVRITDHDKDWNKWLWPNWSSRVSSNC
jgi:5-deoxy-D-glucuronate isomerase